MKTLCTVLAACGLAFAASAQTAGGAADGLAAIDVRTAIEEMLRERLSEAPVRYEAAAKAVAEAAGEGDILATYAIAAVSAEPDSPPSVRFDETALKDALAKTSRTVAAAARNGDRLAQYLCAIQTKNMRTMKSAADADYVNALNDLGARRLADTFRRKKPSGGDMRTRRECFGYFNRAAAHNDPNGLYNLGVCYLKGWGCERDGEQAMENLNAAAAAGHPKAMNLVGDLHKDPVAATRYFAQSASLGNAEGRYRYAKAFLEGRGVEENRERAVELMGAAAKQGLPAAMDEYGQMLYESGEDENCARAIAWWAECAKMHGYARSIDRLGVAYLEGKGVAKDETTAARFFREAASGGCPEAMVHLADCWDAGAGGLAKNHYNANWWRTKAAAERGDRNAKVWLASHRLEE